MNRRLRQLCSTFLVRLHHPNMQLRTGKIGLQLAAGVAGERSLALGTEVKIPIVLRFLLGTLRWR